MTGCVQRLLVGRAGTLPWRGNAVRTAIVKGAIPGPAFARADGLDGDEQADLENHGGPDKAVCAYPVEHLPEWRERLALDALEPGAFGENLAVSGMLETGVMIGDTFRVGGATLQVSQPRGPCFKIAARWGTRKLPGLMAREGTSGYYFRVLGEGEVRAGDELALLQRTSDVSVADVMRATYVRPADPELLERVLAVDELAESWRATLVHLQRKAALPVEESGTSAD